MQIDSALSPTLPGPDRAMNKGASATDDAATQSASTETSTQDDAVRISAEGAATAAQEGSSTQDSTVTDSTLAGALTDDVSAVKSFAYGTLGLERPDQPQQDRNAFYTAGRWLAAGFTVGGIISLLV